MRVFSEDGLVFTVGRVFDQTVHWLYQMDEIFDERIRIVDQSWVLRIDLLWLEFE